MKVAQSYLTLWSHGLYSPWNSPGQNVGVGSLSLLQRILPTQGSDPGLPHFRQILYQLSQKGGSKLSPRGCGDDDGLVAKSCPTHCYPMDYSLPGSSVHGILKARILEWIAIYFSRDLPNPGIKPGSPELHADSLPTELWKKPRQKKKKKKKVAQSCPIIFNPTKYVSPWSSPGQDTGVGCFFPFPADFLKPGIKPVSPIFHADSLPNELWISPGQYTGEYSLSLLQGIFPTQGSNPSPPYCRWILYLLSYQGSPNNI